MKDYSINHIKDMLSWAAYGTTCTFIYSVPIRSIRTLYLRLFIKKMGKHVYVGRNVDIRAPYNIEIGNNVCLNKRVLLDGRGGLTIGNNVDIAQDAYIWTEQHDYNSDYHSLEKKKVVISDYAWICCRSNILPGVKIGRGAVVATNSVVTKDVEPMSLVGGIPAKYISTRNSKLLYNINFKPLY